MTTMNAIVTTKYGSADVLALQTVPKPVPGDHDLLIRVHATAVTAAHAAMREGKPIYGRLFTGLTRPKSPVPGTDFAGVVEAVGTSVTRFKPGDRVFGASDLDGGCYAEYVCLPEDGVLTAVPANMSFTEATAVLDGATTALAFLRDEGQIKAGDRVLINGASGGIGTAAVQLAKQFGAEVTGVCSGRNVALVQALGADHVIDYTQADFTRNGRTYDIIFDTVGKRSFAECKESLTPTGVYLSPVLGLPVLFAMLRTSRSSGKRAKFAATGLLPTDKKVANLAFLRDLLEAGSLKAIIDDCYPLSAADDAQRYVEKGHKRGNVVLQVVAEDASSAEDAPTAEAPQPAYALG